MNVRKELGASVCRDDDEFVEDLKLETAIIEKDAKWQLLILQAASTRRAVGSQLVINRGINDTGRMVVMNPRLSIEVVQLVAPGRYFNVRGSQAGS